MSGCIADKGKISVSMKQKDTTSVAVLNANVATVQIINNQLVITGSGFNDVSEIKVKGNSLNQSFTIESKTSTKIIANSLSTFSFDVAKIFNLILSDANASATFPIDFSLCNASLNGIGFNCAVTAIDKDVLSYDAVSGKWKPRAATGINYLGAFNASTNPPVPTPKPFPSAGSYYIVSADGMIGTTSFVVGDWLISNGTVWQKIGNSTLVTSVFSRTGNVVAQEGDYNLDKLTDVDLSVAPVSGKVLKYNGSHWVAADDLSGGGAGSVVSSSIADGAVTDAKIVAVAASKITGTINSSQILDGTIVNADINTAAAIDYSKLNIPATSIPYAKLNIADGDIPAAKISGLTAVTTVLATTIVDADSTHSPDGNAVFDALGLKLDTAGGALTSAGTITNVPDPVAPLDVSNRQYVDTKLSKTGGTISGSLSVDTSVLLKGTTNYVTLKADAATAAYTLTLPASAGTSGQVLTTNGASPAILSWTTPSASGGAGTVTQVTGSGAISVSNTTTTPAITIATANTTTTGALSSTDWNTFNSKATGTLADGSIFIGNNLNVATARAVTGDVTITNAGVTSIGADKVLDSHIAANTISPSKLNGTRTIASYLRGDNTWSDFATDVRSVTLGTVTPTSATPYSPVSTGDTLSVAFNKTQGQLNYVAANAITKDGTNFLTGTTAIQGITARLTVPTPLIANLNDATNVQYVSTAISDAMAAGAWTVSGANVYRGAGNVGIGTTTTSSALSFGGTAAQKIAMERTTTADAVGNSLTLQAGGATATGATNRAGGNLILSSGISTGNKGSSILLQTAAVGSPGTTSNTPTTKVTITPEGNMGLGFTPWNAFGIYRLNGETTGDFISDNSDNVARYPSFRILNYGGSPAGSIGNPAFTLINSRGTNGSTTPVQAGDALGAFSFNGGTNVNGSYAEGASIWGTATENFTSTANGGNLSFYTTANATKIPKIRMFIDQNGYVGVNTIAPTTQMQVNGTVKATAFQGDGSALTGVSAGASGTDGLVQFASGGALSSSSGLRFISPGALALGPLSSNYNTSGSFYINDASSARAQIMLRNTITGNADGDGSNFAAVFNDLVIANYEAGYMGFLTSNTERMRILANGNVGIGVTTTTYKLEVNGSVAGTTAYATTSDERFKKDITKIPNALERLTSLDGVYYFFRNDEFPDKNFSHHREMGVIAQKVEKIFPEAVSKDEKGFRSVAYTMLIAPIIESIKEIKGWLIGHDQELLRHKREIASVKEQNAKLLEENAAIKSYLCSRDPKASICK